MQKTLTNKFTMYKVVRKWIGNNLPELEFLPGFTDTYNEFSGLLDSIDTLDTTKNMVITGITKTKQESRSSLEIQVAETSRILKVYATFTNNHVMLNDIDFTDRQLGRSSEQLLIVRAHKVLDYAVAQQAGATPYGLTAERIEDLKNSIQSFVDKQSSVRNAIVNRKDTGDQLEATMDEADDLLKGKLDLLMELSQNTIPELYNQYKASRVIIDR